MENLQSALTIYHSLSKFESEDNAQSLSELASIFAR
jgi:hypothetical protein